jgi:hypothetical protein
MSRNGKIARLPRGIRDELNQRLEDGEPGVRLVGWLNGREDVQEVLRAHFKGQPISEQNLSQWTQGGFEEWRRQEESQVAMRGLVEESSGVRELAGDRGMSDRVADMAAVALGELLMAARRMPDGAEKQRSILKIVRWCGYGKRNASTRRSSARRHRTSARRRFTSIGRIRPGSGRRGRRSWRRRRRQRRSGFGGRRRIRRWRRRTLLRQAYGGQGTPVFRAQFRIRERRMRIPVSLSPAIAGSGRQAQGKRSVWRRRTGVFRA